MMRLRAKPFRMKGSQTTRVASADGTACFTGDCAEATAIDARKASARKMPCRQPRNAERRASVSRDWSMRKGDRGHWPYPGSASLRSSACNPAASSVTIRM